MTLSRLARGCAFPAAIPALLFCWLAAAQTANPAEGNSTKDRKTGRSLEDGSIEALTATALKSVVVIRHVGRDGQDEGVGAGFVIAREGLIATSLHVIGEARPITVQLADGRRYDATEVHAWDRAFDLAIIRIDAGPLPALPLGDSDALRQGASVIALGNPLGLEQSVVRGIVSARRDVEGTEMIQVAIPIEPGNSGGPLLDLEGRVQGILTLKSVLTPNLGFATPVKQLEALLERPNPVPMTRWLTLGALDTKEWTTRFGARWSRKAGRIKVESPGRGFGGRSLCLWQQAVPPRPYEVAVLVKLDDEAGAAGLVFASDGEDRHYGFYPSARQLRLTRFDGPTVFSWSILKQVQSERYRPGDWNHLRVRVENGKIHCYVNGQLVAESDDDGLPDGQVGLAKFRDTRAQFKHFQVGTNLADPLPAVAALAPELLRRLDQSRGNPDAALMAELRARGAAGAGAIKERAEQLERDAGRLRRLAAAVHRQAVQSDLLETLDGAEEGIDLLRAALLVAKLDNQDVDIDAYRQQVDDMAREIAAKLSSSAGEVEKLTALTSYLFAENGFHGSRSDYYHPANSYLNEVLDDREGLPITLAVLFLELAGRIGLGGVSGLPLPGHFMVRHVSKEGADRIIDVFDGGKVLSRTEAQERVIEATGEGFRDADYQPATKRQIIVRMLHNLLGLARRNDSAADISRYLEVLVALAPESVPYRLDRARVRLRLNDTVGAKEDLKWLLDRQPEGLDLERITELYQSL